MVYIRNGQVQEAPSGFVAVLKGYLLAIYALILAFFETLISPTAKDEFLANSKRDGAGGSGPGGRRPGGGGGPRITGLDKMSGGNHAAQCRTGG